MLFSVEQAFVGRKEIRAPLKTPAWEATSEHESAIIWGAVFQLTVISKGGCMEEGDPRWVR